MQTPTEAMAAAEQRAFALRKTMGEVCQIAGLKQSVWSRAKSRGSLRPRTLRRVEDALDYLERAAAGEAPEAACG